MPNTVFIALQCCQCSMMQVKQKKKSTNKWICSVCNQKQSVRKVFAQGYMAKDLRHFVQTFNLSQKDQTLARELEGGEGGFWFGSRIESEIPNKKPKFNPVGGSESDTGDIEGDKESRAFPPTATVINTTSKWNKYTIENDVELKTTLKWNKYTTEGDMELKTNSKWNKYTTEDDLIERERTSKWNEYMTEDDMELKTTTSPKAEDDEEQRTHGSIMAKGASKWNNNWTQDDIKADASCNTQGLTVGKSASKWNYYLTQEEEEDDQLQWKFADDNIGVLETIIHGDQKVEDDIHPDFI